MEDMGGSYCHYCEGYTDTRCLADGQSVCVVCEGRKLNVSSPQNEPDWTPHWEEVCDPIGIDEEFRMYELDMVK